MLMVLPYFMKFLERVGPAALLVPRLVEFQDVFDDRRVLARPVLSEISWGSRILGVGESSGREFTALPAKLRTPPPKT